VHRRLLLATRNNGKVRELRALLDGTGIEVTCLADFPDIRLPDESGETFAENALIKARAAAAASGLWALADDSGLEVEALGGAPGVRSARFSGEDATDAENNALLLERLADVPDERRGARFVSAVALCAPGGDCVVREGYCGGAVIRAPHGSGGFGYDPLFYMPGEGMTYAELPVTRKNEISHRARALFLIKQDIVDRLGSDDTPCSE
jgi:XTP/dITP diphosphohydrolase